MTASTSSGRGSPLCAQAGRRFHQFVAVATIAVATGARATEVRVDGSYRLRLALDTDLALDETPYQLGQKTWAEHRLRLTPKIVDAGEVEIQASFDVLSGLVAGDLAPSFQGLGWTERSERNGLRAEGFDFRHLFVQLKLPVGLVQIGQMPSHWGMGMVANGGDGEEETDFGDVRFGDIVDRLLFATRPFAFLGERSEIGKHLALAVGGDLVYRDRYAQLVQRSGSGLSWGDVAWQAISALVFEPSEATRAGVYVTRRVQSYAHDGGDLHVWAFDAHLRTLFVPGLLGGGTVSLEAEAAQLYGGTSHAPNLNSLGTTRVSQQGAAARAMVSKGPFEMELESGYASGDSNPFDDQATAFTMNRDFKVGLVLWDEVMLFQTQNSARRLADPNLVGRPPPGIDLLPTEGAVTNALYLKPTLRYRPPILMGRLRAVVSLLWARAPEPVVDAYQALVSSAPRNAFGAPAARNYGTELDGAFGYRARIAGSLAYELGVQTGVLFPGDAFNHADGSHMPPAYAAKFRATLLF